MTQYHPTHALIVSSPVEGTPRHNNILIKILEAAAPFGSCFVVTVETEWISEEYPSVIQKLDEAFSKTSVEDTGTYEAEPSTESLRTLQSLLEMTGGPRVYGTRKLELRRGEDTWLRYVPEHELFTFNQEATGGMINAVQSKVENEPAVILSKETMVEWEYAGTQYSISPPSLCVGNVCHDLSRLASIETRPSEILIELQWNGSKSGTIGQAANWISSRVGLSRPDTLDFESTQEFSATEEVLEKLLSGTGKEKL